METVFLIIIQILLLSAMGYAMHTIGFISGINFQKELLSQREKLNKEHIRQLEKYVERLEKERRRHIDGY